MVNNRERLFEIMLKLNPDFKIITNNNVNEAGVLNTIRSGINSVTTTKTNIGQNVAKTVGSNDPREKSFGGEKDPNFRLETYGDLKKIINVIQIQQKGKKIGGIGVDALLNAVPGYGTAKSLLDITKVAINKPDNIKTNTWLDRLDIDDNASKIIDDNVENGFIQAMADKFNSQPDNKPLEQNFNMNVELANYLKTNYNNRTITGISE